MITKLKIPKISANVEEETITAWYKKEGARVKKGEPIAELTTDKASFDLESPRAGILRKVLAMEKSILPVGFIMGLIGDAEDSLPDVSPTNKKILERHRGAPRGEKSAVLPKKRAVRKSIRATPAARRLARQAGVELAKIKVVLDVDVINEMAVKAYLAGKNE